jgi:hypothetical protein
MFCTGVTLGLPHCTGRKPTQTGGVQEQGAKDSIPSPCFGLTTVPEKSERKPKMILP